MNTSLVLKLYTRLMDNTETICFHITLYLYMDHICLRNNFPPYHILLEASSAAETVLKYLTSSQMVPQYLDQNAADSTVKDMNSVILKS